MYHDKNLIFSQTNRRFKTKFSTLIRDIYAHISMKYYWKISMSRTVRLIWNEIFNSAIYQLKSSVKHCFKQVGFIKYLPSTIFKIYDVIVYVIYDFSLGTVVHYMMISFSNMTPHQLTRQNWLSANCRDFINKDSWPPNSPDLNPLDFHVWSAMLLAYNKVNPKPHNIAELKEILKRHLLGQIAYRLNTPFSSRCSETPESLC